MIAYLRDEDGAEVVEDYLASDEECVAHAVNLCEVYYDYLRAEDEHSAKSAIEDLKGDGVMIREDIEESFWQKVGGYKVVNRVSLADCFAIALANRIGARIMTSDHHEFDPLAKQGICRVLFIR